MIKFWVEFIGKTLISKQKEAPTHLHMGLAGVLLYNVQEINCLQ